MMIVFDCSYFQVCEGKSFLDRTFACQENLERINAQRLPTNLSRLLLCQLLSSLPLQDSILVTLRSAKLSGIGVRA